MRIQVRDNGRVASSQLALIIIVEGGGDAERAHALYDMLVTAPVSHALMSWLKI